MQLLRRVFPMAKLHALLVTRSIGACVARPRVQVIERFATYSALTGSTLTHCLFSSSTLCKIVKRLQVVGPALRPTDVLNVHVAP